MRWDVSQVSVKCDLVYPKISAFDINFEKRLLQNAVLIEHGVLPVQAAGIDANSN
jgi:hypothetical protein